MFPAEKEGEWEPYKIREKKKPVSGDGDVEMGGTAESNEPVYEEDLDSDEGAVYPLVGMFRPQYQSFKSKLTKGNRGAHYQYALLPCTAQPCV